MFLKKSTSQVDRQVKFQRGLYTCPLDEILNQKRKTCIERGTGAARGLHTACIRRQGRAVTCPEHSGLGAAVSHRQAVPLLIALSPPSQGLPSLVAPDLRQDPCSRRPGPRSDFRTHLPLPALAPRACAPLRVLRLSAACSQLVQNLNWDEAALQPP